MRCFVAIELGAPVRSALGSLQGRLKRARLGHLGRWVAPESIHLTLKFLGDVPVDRVPELCQALNAACRQVLPFEITITGLGCFPSPRRPRVIWVGAQDPTGALQRLQQAVERELGRLGFRPEERGFAPHLTLARIRDQARDDERAELGAWIRQQPVAAVATMRVARVSLMRSELCPSGPVYTCLEATPLQQTEG